MVISNNVVKAIFFFIGFLRGEGRVGPDGRLSPCPAGRLRSGPGPQLSQESRPLHPSGIGQRVLNFM
jgi:hypothetical protein